MRILHILDHSLPLHSGYTFRTCAILRQQQAMGWETFHVTSAKQQQAEALLETFDGLAFYRTPPPSGWTAGLPVLNQIAITDSLARRLDEIIGTVRPDILHAHSPALNGIAALRAGRKHGLPVVYECRAFWEDAAVDHGTSRAGGLRYRATRWLETYVFRHAQAVTTICEGLRQDIVRRGIPAEKVTVIPNAVDIAKFRLGGAADGELRQALGLSGKTVLGFVGSFYAYEGLPLLLRVLPTVLRRQPDTRLLLVGGGPQEQHLKDEAERLGVGGSVIFAGRVPHQQVQDYYAQIDLLVYPRQRMRLTDLVTPLKPLEAMAQGLLVAASNVGGHRELIEDGKNGILFQPDDPVDLADKILALLERREQWPALRAAGRKFVEEERNWSASVARYAAVYAPLVSAAGRPA
ncbi:MAG: TIGR04063 family PEP-CTERM/XrtA system glycosyltransferase [Candidatus Methylumidiphilus sp.]